MDAPEILRTLGFDDAWGRAAEDAGAALADVGRVRSEQRGRSLVATPVGEVAAALAGRLRRSAADDPSVRPVVGDWVVLRRAEPGEADELRVVEAVLPRRSFLARKAAGRAIAPQLVAANVDVALVVSALGRDVNERRIERFVAIARAGGVEPFVVLTKADLVADAVPYVERVRGAAPGVGVAVVSATTGAGLEVLDAELGPGRTLVLLGTSGAGKSTLVNAWLGRAGGAAPQVTREVGLDGKGRHTTTARELFVLPSGALVVDTPGVREVGVWEGGEGVGAAFEDVSSLAGACRFTDCRHTTEPGCAVRAAVERGGLAAERLEAWRRLEREQEHVGRQLDAAAGATRKAADRRQAKALRKHLVAKGRR